MHTVGCSSGLAIKNNSVSQTNNKQEHTIKQINMRNIFILVLFLSLTINSFSQQSHKLFLDADSEVTDSASAYVVREAIIDNGIYKVTDKDTAGEMLNYCEYSSINPIIENGLAIHYYKPGKIYSKGMYSHGKITGVWEYYQDNKVFKTVDYTNSSIYDKSYDCNITNFAKKRKAEEAIALEIQRLLSVEFNLPARTRDKAKYFDIDIDLVVNELGDISCIDFLNSFDIDLEAELIRLLKTYKVKHPVKAPLKISFTYSRQYSMFVIVEDMPKFNGGDLNDFRNYIQSKLNYPEEAAKKGIQGKVFVQFLVDTDGEVINVKIVKGLHPALDAETVRAVRSSPYWEPGKQRGRNVSVMLSFPVNFILN